MREEVERTWSFIKIIFYFSNIRIYLNCGISLLQKYLENA